MLYIFSNTNAIIAFYVTTVAQFMLLLLLLLLLSVDTTQFARLPSQLIVVNPLPSKKWLGERGVRVPSATPLWARAS